MPSALHSPRRLTYLQAAASVSLVWLLVVSALVGLGLTALVSGLFFAIDPLLWLLGCVLPFLFLAHPPETIDGIMQLERAVVDHPFAWTVAQWVALVAAVLYLGRLVPHQSPRRVAIFLIGLQVAGVTLIAWAHPYVFAKLRM